MRITVASATEALSLKDQLTEAGLVIHRDYTWCYHPLIDMYPLEDEPAWVEFHFRDPALEVFYSLKWQ